ncbi:MAG: DUF2070 family protein [Candidatus Bathyarchaeota archaeon]|nr:DUF2070 family protein [Candidatus Bathyarchaeota archaeon]
MLPSYRNIILLSALACMVGGLISSISLSFSLLGMIKGIFLGFSLLFATLLSNHVLAFLVVKKDPVYNLRRTAALSLYAWILWVLFIFLGGVVAAFFGSLWAVRLCLFGFSAVLILRFIVLHVTSSGGFKRFLAASVIPPFLCLIPFVIFWLDMVDPRIVSLFSAYALIVSLLSSFSFIHLLNSVGKHVVGKPSLVILKAFLLNWIADSNTSIEAILEELGEERDIEVSVAKFDGHNLKAFLVVPSVHPGPFKNVGSSFLPSMLKNALEQKFNCVACVPLGLLGHELDLASQTQNQKIIDCVVDSADFKAYEDGATPFIKVQNGLATACCQIFGKSAIIAFSLAPNTTEDLPQELDFLVRKEAEKLRLQSCMVINAHNSINGEVNSKDALEALRAAAVECLERANSQARMPFKVGVATVKPKEFSLRDGMGPGGITAMVISVGEQRVAYIVIDGNNMISGLREKALSALQCLGIDNGEIFTTDTHSVNALTLNERGYHPIGEVIDQKKLISYIEEVTNSAIANLETAKVGFRSVVIPKVKVIGQGSLEKLCLLPGKAVKRAKKIVVPLFAATSLFLVLFLSFL